MSVWINQLSLNELVCMFYLIISYFSYLRRDFKIDQGTLRSHNLHVTVKRPLTCQYKKSLLPGTVLLSFFYLFYFYFCGFQIVLQDHNYEADSYTSGVFPVSHLKCGEYGDLNPRLFAMSAQTGQASKTNNGVCCGSPVVNA